MNKLIVGIRFQTVGKVYHFDASKDPEIKPGDFAVVKTSRGTQLGQVVAIIEDPEPPMKGTWKRIERVAHPGDLLNRKVYEQKELAALIFCRSAAADLNYDGLKLVKAEYSFDGESVSILYNSEGDDEVKLNPLIREMKKEYPSMKIEFRRIGPRDVAKEIGGMGVCGLEKRCCSSFLTDFSPISIKMAKAQGISLDPSEITGMCGRLRCCLIYEYEQYAEARKTLPKRGKKVVTPMGEGKVIDVNPLKESVVVRLNDEDATRAEFTREEIEPWNELEALRRAAEQACEKHPNGECDCKQKRMIQNSTQEPDNTSDD